VNPRSYYALLSQEEMDRACNLSSLRNEESTASRIEVSIVTVPELGFGTSSK